MNISVIDCQGVLSCRPDTTWEKENKDFYAPDEISEITYSPVMFARISKAGKCIAEKFAERYYEGIAFGVLLYAEGHPSGALFDHSSLLPSVTWNKCTLDLPSNTFTLCKNGEEIFSFSVGEKSRERINSAISRASAIVSQRIGDLVAIELEAPKALASRMNSNDHCELTASFCENLFLEKKVIF